MTAQDADVEGLLERAAAAVCADEVAARSLIDTLLGPLIAYDADHRGDLVHTVAVLARSGWSSSVAARRLFLLRNSVLYRRSRIEDIAGVRLDDPDVRFALELALRVRRRLAASPPDLTHPSTEATA